MSVLSPEALVLDLQEIIRNRHPVHPLRKLLLTGRLTKEQLQGWAKNQFHEFRNIHRFFGVRYQKCPVPELRRAPLENMVEEEGEDLFGGKYPSHAELWVRFGESIEVPQQEMLAYEPLPGVRAALEMYVQLVQQSHWAVAIGTGDAVRRVSKWVIHRIRWHRFDVDLQSWLQGRHDTPPPGMATEDLDGLLRARAATLLKDA